MRNSAFVVFFVVLLLRRHFPTANYTPAPGNGVNSLAVYIFLSSAYCFPPCLKKRRPYVHTGCFLYNNAKENET